MPPLLDAARMAQLLLKLGCVQLSPHRPFTYSSGATGPIYCDNRRVWSFPQERGQIVAALRATLEQSGWRYRSLAGLATAGIPMACFVAAQTQAPLLYIRPTPKKHGQKNQIEGHFERGECAVLLEDLVNQGHSLKAAARVAQEGGLHLAGCLCLVDYQMPAARQRLEQWNLPLISLTDFDTLVEVAATDGHITSTQRDELVDWHRQQSSTQAL